MSGFWSGYIIVLTLGSIFACWWLLWWTQKGAPAKTNAEGEVETTGHVYDGIEEYNNPLPRWWLYLFYITIVFALVYLALYPGLGTYKGYLGWSQVSAYEAEVDATEERYSALYAGMAATPIPELIHDGDAMDTGRRLFANNCAVCHGADARGAVGFPNLADGEWLYGGSPEAIQTSILNGRQGVMPAWGSILGDRGVDEVAAHVYSLNGRDVPAAMLGGGASKYAATCAGCHGADGTGNQALGAPNLTDEVWLYGGSLAAIQQSIRDGRNGKMPAHQSLLGEDRAHIVAAYIYSLSAGKDGTDGKGN